MADPKLTDEKPTEKKSTEVKSSKKTDDKKPTATASQSLTYKDKNFWLLLISIVAAVFFMSLAYVAGHRAATRDYNDVFHRPYSKMSGYGHHGDMRYREGMIDGFRDTSENTRVKGVVTAVDGDTITVAGNGSITTVSISDNTAFRGSAEPAQVNDSILAIGAKDGNGTLVASSIRLLRQ